LRDLSLTARIYLIAVYLLGLWVFLWNLPSAAGIDLMGVLVLSLLASFFLIFKVVGATIRSHYTLSFLVYGFAFAHFGLSETLLVILISNIVEWLWNRPPWYIQAFNTTSNFVVMAAAYLVFNLINPSGSLLTSVGVLSIAVSMVVYTLLNHIILGIVLWLARGENLKTSRMLDVFPFVMDVTMLTFGCMLNVVWNTSPYSMVLFLLPLYLIYTTLRIPALERQTETDVKTGLFNHRYFMNHLASELDRANRFDRPLSVIMVDLDLLRNINNTYGHLAGDEILIGVARILKKSVRDYDVVSRFGGEEFAILLPEATVQQSYERGEVIRRAIEDSEFTIPTSVTPIRITVSLGIAERESFTQTPEEIIHNSDTALYHSKLSGRNRSYAYTREAYREFLGSVEKKLISGESEMLQLEAKPGQNNAADFPAAETTYHKGEPATNSSSSKEPTGGFRSSRQAVNLYVGGMALAALALILALYRLDPQYFQINWMQSGPGLLTCMVLVVLTEIYSIDLYLGKTSLSTSAVPLLAGALLYGPTAAIILSLTYAVVVGSKYRSKFDKYVFNLSNQVIAAMVYLFALSLSGWSLLEIPLLVQAVLIVVAALIVYLVNASLISIGIGLDLHRSPADIWKEQYAWLVTIYVGIGLISTAFIAGYRQEGVVGALLMMVPLLLLRISQRLYVERTRTAVTELREKNIALENKADEIDRLNDGLLNTLAEIIDLRDPYVLGHSRRVTDFATNIARNMGLNLKQIELVRRGSLLHDVGKLGVPMEILSKPAKLTREEYEVIKQHPETGARVLEMNPSLRQLTPIVRHHHEFYDGHGYPGGLSGQQIPVEARIVAVADAIESMASHRPYRKALSKQAIIDELKRFSGSQFDPQVVKHAVELLESHSEEKLEHRVVQTGFAIPTTQKKMPS